MTDTINTSKEAVEAFVETLRSKASRGTLAFQDDLRFLLECRITAAALLDALAKERDEARRMLAFRDAQDGRACYQCSKALGPTLGIMVDLTPGAASGSCFVALCETCHRAREAGKETKGE